MVLAAGLAISALVWFASGGRIAFLFLPLLLAAPMLFRRWS
jgi:hypothetical protein